MIKKLVLLFILIPSLCWGGMVIQKFTSAGGSGSVGTTSESDSFNIFNGVTYYTSYTATAGTVRYAHIKINDGNGANVCVALKNSSGTDLLNGTASAGDDTAQWVNIDCGGDTELTATDYYVSVRSTGTVSVRAWVGPDVTVYESSLNCGDNIATGGSSHNSRDLTIIFNNSAGDPS